ncbi:FAD-dependent monooxygenase [Paraburkholderia silviterrae]|uniref:FAD-binding protein n=1 Tax=Paraburkholderia silviterrae TaxID=2528715 RepID=A0A4R5M0U9_9BURK|nr:FAD-dependent monooxygenase [Paraburkholderia silviterrae]TDG18802.1 FAD-binding protein [Paraburkholderia silviterrae]
MSLRSTKVAIAGAGIGGLTAAIALRQRGCEVVVVEQAPQLGEVGAGVQMSPNAVKVLRAIGVEPLIRDLACEPLAFTGRDWRSGRVLYRTPIKGTYERLYGAGYYHVHRADLHHALTERLGDADLRLGQRVAGIEQDQHAASLKLESGETIEADVIIGADGIHSAIRRSILGDEKPRFTGNICWRGMVPVDALPKGHVELASSNWLGPKGHVVHYYVKGGAMVNFVAVYETDQWTEESWSTPSSVDEILKTYAGWNQELLTTFSKAEGCFKWALYDRDPLGRWSQGRVTLLGDAAHPMLPFLAQGAAMAIEDGYELAGTIGSVHAGAGIEAALVAYERQRIPRTSRVQLGARARGATMHLRSPWARMKRNFGFMLQGLRTPESTTHRAEWIFGYDATTR